MRNILCLFLTLSFASYTFAVMPVADATSLAESVKQTFITLHQIRIQKEKIEKDIAFMTRQIESLGSLGFEDVYRLDEHIKRISGFQEGIRKISYRYRSIDAQFEKLYGPSKKPFKKRFKAWEKQTDQSIKEAMKAHGLIDTSRKRLWKIDDLIAKQRKAKGDLAALQVLAEINAEQARQMNDLTHIIAADSRAKQSQIMEKRSSEKGAREASMRLLDGFNVHKKSRPLSYLPTLGKRAPKRN